MGNKEDVTQSGVDTIKQRRTDMQSKDGRQENYQETAQREGLTTFKERV